jgi:hypothetical protein
MSPEQLLDAHRALWREAFSLKYSLLRVVRSLGRLRFGAFLMCLVMNGFYCLKRLRGNEPIALDPSVSDSERRPMAPDIAAIGLTHIRPGRSHDSAPGAWTPMPN